MIRQFCVLAGVALVGFLPAACNKAESKFYPVSGTVMMDGKPMQDGEVMFVSPGEVPLVMPVKNGAFSGTSTAGKKKVEIRAYKEVKVVENTGMYKESGVPGGEMTKENILPPEYNFKSTLTADVNPAGANEFKFDVKSEKK